MNRTEAVERMTQVATRPGQPVTSDETFELFAALVPDSPWSTRLLRLRDIFNALATAATLINELEPIAKWEESVKADPSMADEPDLVTLHKAFTIMRDAMSNVRASVEMPPVAGTVQPSPTPEVTALLHAIDPTHNPYAPQPLDIHDLARQAGAMRYQSEVPKFGSVSGWSFRDSHLEAFVKAVRDHE